MSEQKKYLDNIGLETYDGLIKSYISSEVEVVKDAVEEIDLTPYETIEDSTTKFDEAKALSETNLELAKSHAEDKDAFVLTSAQSYTDSAVAQKSQVRINIWEADD